MHKKLIQKGLVGFQFNGTPGSPFNSSALIGFSKKSPSNLDYEVQTAYNLGWINDNQASMMSPKFGKHLELTQPILPGSINPLLVSAPQIKPLDPAKLMSNPLETSTAKASGLSNNNSISQSINNFTNSGNGGLALAGMGFASNALGIKPQYLMNNKLDNALGMAEDVSKNFGNPLVNAAGDFAAGGIGKLMGMNTDKVVGGGMAGVNAVSNVLSNFGPIGMAAGVALKVGNMIGGKNLDEFKTDTRVLLSSSYTGSAKNIKDTSDKYGGGMVSGIDRLFGNDRKYNNRIQDLKDVQRRVKGILETSDQNLAAQTGSADMFRIKNSMNMQNNSYLFNGVLAAKKGGRIQNILKSQNGGKLNIIPEGALHAHKHKLDLDDITSKGIPVISKEDGGEITQHAEIERNEIVFTKEVSNKLEELWKKYNEDSISKKEKDLIAILVGEILTYEIIENTDDRTGLITIID